MPEPLALIGWCAIEGTAGSTAGGYGRRYGRNYGLSSVSASPTSYKFATQEHSVVSGYRAKLKQSPSFKLSIPPVGRVGRGLGEQSARVELSNVHTGDTTIAPAISYLLSNAQEVRGKYAEAGILDQNGNNIAFIAGKVVEVPRLDRLEAHLEIANEDSKLRSLMVPKRKVRDIFPSANTDSVTAQDPCVVWPFGRFYTAELSLCMGDNYADLSFVISNTGTGRYLYVDLTNIANTPIASTDWLEYDVWWGTANAKIAVDIECTDGTRLKNQAVNDQNGFAATPTTDISSRCTAAIYRRRISLASLAGKTVSKFMIACEAGTAGVYVGKIGQMVIVNDDGAVLREIVTTFVSSFTTAKEYGNDLVDSKLTITKDRNYYFGPIKDEGGLTSVLALYRINGVVSGSEYSVTQFLGLKLCCFPLKQTDNSGKPTVMIADLRTTAYASNPILIAKALLSDASDGAGELVDDSAFSTAATTMSATLQIRMGQGLDRQVPLGRVLDDVLVHGAYLQRTGTFGGSARRPIVPIIDTDGLHTLSPVTIEVPATDPTLAKHRNNAEVLSRNRGGKLSEYVVKRKARGYLYRGLGENPTPSWLIESERSRAGDGIDGDPLDFPYIIDGNSLDRALDYEWRQEVAYSDARYHPLRLRITRLAHGIQLAVNQKVTVSVEDLFIPATTYLVRGLDIDDNGVTADVSLYPSYTYTAGTKIRIDSKATRGTDYSRSYPNTPTSPTQGTATVRASATGDVEILQPVSVTAPPQNVTEILFTLHERTGTTISTDSIASRAVAVAPGAVATARFVMLVGNEYGVRMIARNTANEVGFQDSLAAAELSLTAPINNIRPANGAISELVSTPGQVQVKIVKNPESDVTRYKIIRSKTSLVGQGVEIGEAVGGETPSYLDVKFVETDYDVPLFYFVLPVNSSGRQAESWSAPRQTVVTKITRSRIRRTREITDVAHGSGTGTISITDAGDNAIVTVDAKFLISNDLPTTTEAWLRIHKNTANGPVIGQERITVGGNTITSLPFLVRGVDNDPAPETQTYVARMESAGVALPDQDDISISARADKA